MEHLDEVRGCVLAAILVCIFLAFAIDLFSENSILVNFFKAFLATIGGIA